jgi:hypothetical protein
MMQYGADYLDRSVFRLPGGMLADMPGNLMQIGAVTFVVAAVLAVLMAVVGIRNRDNVTVAAAALAGLPLVLLANPPLTTALLRQSVYLTTRIALVLPFTAYLGVAWAVSPAVRPKAVRVVAAVLAVAVLAAALSAAKPVIDETWRRSARMSVWKTRRVDIRVDWGERAVASMGREIGHRYPIVAGDPQTSFYFAGVLPAAVVAVPVLHSPFAVEETDGALRRRDMLRLMRLDSEADRRKILERWDASYVVVAKQADSPEVLAEMRTQTGLLRPVVDGPGIVLFAVVR